MFASSSAGIVIFYGLFQLAVWWFCHVVSLFWGIQFPFHARSFKTTGRIKYIHITMVIVGLVLPTLPVIVTFTAGNPSTRGFGLTRFPPILCTSLQRDPTFYSSCHWSSSGYHNILDHSQGMHKNIGCL